MARELNDTTSTCGSCAYWEHDKSADGIHPFRVGYCQWTSVPAWVDKRIKNRSPEHQKMLECDGATCWLHTKRGVAPASQSAARLAGPGGGLGGFIKV